LRKEPRCGHHATLARRVIDADGKPTLKEVGYLAQINEDRLNDPKVQREFWGRARVNLGRLRVQPNEIALIEADLAERVPMPQQQPNGSTWR